VNLRPSEAPRYSEIEKRMVQDWMEVLQLSEIDVHDQFLDLGGDSLAAILCISRMRSAFGVEFPIDAFFLDDATISNFARMIEPAIGEEVV
jgi:acyl carrier protein